MNIGNSQFLSIEQLQDQYLKQQKTAPSSKPTQGISFEEILHKQQAQEIEAKELKFSKHASNRLNDRNIELTKEQINYIYAEEAEVLNMALFGMTAKEWRTKNQNLDGNMRDYATINELICLANLENLNSVFINDGLKQSERLKRLNQIAISQMEILNSTDMKYLNGGS